MAALTTPDEILDLLKYAIEQQEVCVILYAHDGTGSARAIIPSARYRNERGEDYISAYDSIHAAQRNFRIERIVQAHLIDAEVMFP